MADKEVVFRQFTGLWGWVLNNKESMLVNEPSQDPRSSGTPLGHIAIQKFLAAPALHGERLVGMIALANPGRDYTQHDLLVLDRLAALYSLGIQRKQAEMERQAHEQFQALLNEITRAALQSPDLHSTLHALANQMVRIIQADHCYITRWDHFHYKTVPVAASRELDYEYATRPSEPGEQTMTESLFKAGKSLVAEDTHNSPYISLRLAAQFPSTSLLGLPLKTGDQFLGACLLGFSEPHHFTDLEIQRCEQAAAQVSLAIAKAYLLEETHRKAEELETLTEVSTAMRTARSRAEILPVIVGQILALFEAQGAAVGLPNPDQDDLIVELGLGKWSHWTGRHLPHTQCINEKVVNTGPAHSAGKFPFEESISPSNQEVATLYTTCAPLIASEQILGVLWLGTQAPLHDEQIRLFTAIADMAANAIQRQALYDDLQIQLDALSQAQARLVQSEKLAAVGELVAGVAHELNNPLTSVVLYAQMLQQLDLGPETRRDLERVVGESMRAAKIVRGLLDFARQRPVERKPTQVNEAITNSIEFVAYDLQRNQITCELALDPGLPLTLADHVQLQQVFINLLTNARQAIRTGPGKGIIQIRTETGHSLFLGEQQGAPVVIRIYIKDDGPGIPPEAIPRIFDPFFTTKPAGQGTGLGLSICHGIISEHGGHIWADNQPGQGAIFIIELPILAPKPSEAVVADAKTSHPDDIAAHQILVIDDEPAVVEIIARALRRKGYQVDTANDGTSALACLYRTNYDLVLCDVRMPDMSGPDLYRQIKLKDAQMAARILFTTGDIVSPARRQFFDETGAPYLAKPFELDQLIERVRQHFN